MQLVLSFTLNSKMLWQNFIGEKNQQIVKFLSELFEQSSSSVVYIYGERSSGKTHLLQGCAFAALDKSLGVVYLDFAQEMPEDILQGLEEYDWVCIDNVDCLRESQQQALFDLYNRVTNTSTKLVISADTLPGELNSLKDLKTRLSLATVFALEAISDTQKKQIIQQQMNDRNLRIDQKIVDYLFKHYSRDLDDLLNVINKLDKVSLQQKSSITIPLIKQVLGI